MYSTRIHKNSQYLCRVSQGVLSVTNQNTSLPLTATPKAAGPNTALPLTATHKAAGPKAAVPVSNSHLFFLLLLGPGLLDGLVLGVLLLLLVRLLRAVLNLTEVGFHTLGAQALLKKKTDESLNEKMFDGVIYFVSNWILTSYQPHRVTSGRA